MALNLDAILRLTEKDPSLHSQLKSVSRVGILYAVLHHTIERYDRCHPSLARAAALEILKSMIAEGEVGLDFIPAEEEIPSEAITTASDEGEVVERTDEDLWAEEQSKESLSWSELLARKETGN